MFKIIILSIIFCILLIQTIVLKIKERLGRKLIWLEALTSIVALIILYCSVKSYVIILLIALLLLSLIMIGYTKVSKVAKEKLLFIIKSILILSILIVGIGLIMYGVLRT